MYYYDVFHWLFYSNFIKITRTPSNDIVKYFTHEIILFFIVDKIYKIYITQVVLLSGVKQPWCFLDYIKTTHLLFTEVISCFVWMFIVLNFKILTNIIQNVFHVTVRVLISEDSPSSVPAFEWKLEPTP